MSKSGPKRTRKQRDEDLHEVERLDSLGYTQPEIAAKMNVTQQQVSYDIRSMAERYKKRQLMEREVGLARELRKLDFTCKEALEAWERSKGDKEKDVVQRFRQVIEAETKTDEHGNLIVVRPERIIEKVNEIHEREGRLPDNAYLRTILETCKTRAELMGWYAPKTSMASSANYHVHLSDVDASGKPRLPWFTHGQTDEEAIAEANAAIGPPPGTSQTNGQAVIPMQNGLKEQPPEEQPPDESAEIEDYEE